jgi:hypothetical protein
MCFRRCWISGTSASADFYARTISDRADGLDGCQLLSYSDHTTHCKEAEMTTTFRRVYLLLGLAAIATFFGHGMWAVRGKDSFVELVTGSFDHVFGVTVGTGTATTIVNAIGGFDIFLSVLMGLALVGFMSREGALRRFALSPVMIAVWSWAILWGLATGASRMTGAGVWYPEVWDLVERGPNILVPAALLVMTLFLRRQETIKIPDFPVIPEGEAVRPKVPVA